LRNKIAAGEVIERPASVVKELLENSIDAGSTDIRTEILRGGKGLIRVADDGEGMDREDALLCIEPHATSKLLHEDDLFNIRTMGFRGEALPSIASVSRLRLITGLRDALSGLSVEIEGGEVKEVKDAPSVGTTIEIRDLFFNTPARKKFLKSDSTELFHIIDAVTKEALSHWEIGFRLFTGKQETMTLPRASGPRERILQTYGTEFLEGLSEVNAGARGMKMTAFVTKGENFRGTRSHQFIFLNRRPVKDQTISHAVYSAYEGVLPQGRHPIFFLYIEIDPKTVDFNVHPTKREVRFENKEEVHRFIAAGLRETLRTERDLRHAPFAEAPAWAKNPGPSGIPDFASGFPGPSSSSAPFPHGSGISENIELRYRPSVPFIYLGDTYVAMAGKGGLTLLDHHAAHERVLYERFVQAVDLASHQLLFPVQVKLSPHEYRTLIERKDLLGGMGIEIDDFGQDTLIVRTVPDALKEADLRGILSDVAASLAEGAKPEKPLREAVAARIACHASVRGKEILSEEGLQRLLSDLEKTEHPDQCPHGRPTKVLFSLDDLKKMFRRK
jgi:DNA mismatch repair protein MutL